MGGIKTMAKLDGVESETLNVWFMWINIEDVDDAPGYKLDQI